jgi:sterol desaturase/sphingolipid hydroxylase (fatty acid hydroxylase superfamily)
MHAWHHAKSFPEPHRYGVNYGISLSLWDYLFRTAYIPNNGRDIQLGYPGDEDMPQGFWKQALFPFTKRKSEEGKVDQYQ